MYIFGSISHCIIFLSLIFLCLFKIRQMLRVGDILTYYLPADDQEGDVAIVARVSASMLLASFKNFSFLVLFDFLNLTVYILCACELSLLL